MAQATSGTTCRDHDCDGRTQPWRLQTRTAKGNSGRRATGTNRERHHDLDRHGCPGARSLIRVLTLCQAETIVIPGMLPRLWDLPRVNADSHRHLSPSVLLLSVATT